MNNDIRDDYLRFTVEDEETTTSSNNIFATIVKALVILFLVLLVIVLGGLAYKYLIKDDKSDKINNSKSEVVQKITQQNTNPTIKQKQQNSSQNSKQITTTQKQSQQQIEKKENTLENKITTQVKQSTSGLKKEEIALIVQAVLAQMKQSNQTQDSTNKANIQPVKNEVKMQKKEEIGNTLEVSTGDDNELFNSLQSLNADSIENSAVDTTNLQNINTNQKVKSTKKERDTFNKVIVENKTSSSTDDLSKLYNQLNQIMKKDKSKIKSKNKKFVKKLIKETRVRKNAMRIITVRPGDTLSSIAKRAYGNAMKYGKIFEANPELISNPNRIYPGQKLRVPK